MKFEVANFVKDKAHDEFVEENYQNQGYVDNCVCYLHIVFVVVCMFNQRSFLRKNEEENCSDTEKKKSSKTPSSHNPEDSLVLGVVDMLPADLFWLRSLCQ